MGRFWVPAPGDDIRLPIGAFAHRFLDTNRAHQNEDCTFLFKEWMLCQLACQTMGAQVKIPTWLWNWLGDLEPAIHSQLNQPYLPRRAAVRIKYKGRPMGWIRTELVIPADSSFLLQTPFVTFHRVPQEQQFVEITANFTLASNPCVPPWAP